MKRIGYIYGKICTIDNIKVAIIWSHRKQPDLTFDFSIKWFGSYFGGKANQEQIKQWGQNNFNLIAALGYTTEHTLKGWGRAVPKIANYISSY